MKQSFSKITGVRGTLSLPGDKSISHRAVMFGCLADGKSRILNALDSGDLRSTRSCFSSLGCTINENAGELTIEGKGLFGLSGSSGDLYAGNSGTTARLISGILAAQKFPSVITGDESLSNRPMGRVIEPLRLMGADIKAENNLLPLRIYPSANIHPIEYTLPVASAQVKSAVLLAGLHLEGETAVIENEATRNHTEKMLGLPVIVEGNTRKIISSKKHYPGPMDFYVPSDISSAAFFIALALLSGNSELLIKNVSLNESRTGILKILKSMGGDIRVENANQSPGEEYGDLIIKSGSLKNITIEKEIIPNIIDEIPILSVCGVFAEGKFEIRGAEELRHKESDRISALCENFRLLGLDVNEFPDGFEISGEVKIKNPVFESYGDHRIAMSFSVMSILLGGGEVNGFECVGISNPRFLDQLNSIL